MTVSNPEHAVERSDRWRAAVSPFDMALPEVVPAPPVDLTLVDRPWAFADANAAGIDAHWARETAANPALFNGKVLVALESGFGVDGTYFGVHTAVDFKAFLAWRNWGFGAGEARNIFGAALIRPADGGFVMGRMAAHTSNPGLIYPPSGTLDMSDVDANGRIDIDASIVRELREETGLRAANFRRGEAWLVVETGARSCYGRVYHSALDGATLVELIGRNIARDPDPELAEAVHVRRGMALPDSVFLPYVRSIIETLG